MQGMVISKRVYFTLLHVEVVVVCMLVYVNNKSSSSNCISYY